MDVLGRVWNAVKDAVDGLKTLGVAVVLILLGLADYFDMVNIKPVLDYLLGEDKAAKIMIFMPFLFATLRFLSTGAPRWSRRWREQRHDELSRVDEPEDSDVTPKQEGGI